MNPSWRGEGRGRAGCDRGRCCAGCLNTTSVARARSVVRTRLASPAPRSRCHAGIWTRSGGRWAFQRRRSRIAWIHPGANSASSRCQAPRAWIKAWMVETGFALTAPSPHERPRSRRRSDRVHVPGCHGGAPGGRDWLQVALGPEPSSGAEGSGLCSARSSYYEPGAA